jgi:predicted nucleic acid-binding Zn ribbon protein
MTRANYPYCRVVGIEMDLFDILKILEANTKDKEGQIKKIVSDRLMRLLSIKPKHCTECGKPIPLTRYYKQHDLEKINFCSVRCKDVLGNRRRYAKAKEDNPVVYEKIRENSRRCNIKTRAKWKAEGKCQKCGGPRDYDDRVTCERCLRAARIADKYKMR